MGNYATVHLNPVERWVEALEEIKALHDENKKLYERLLQSEREKIEILRDKKA